MKLLFLFFLIFVASACNNHTSSSKFQIPNYEKMADKITKNTAKKLHQNKNLVLIGTGGGMMYNVRMAAMSFVYKQEVDIETGRELLISCVNEYLAAFNSNEEIQPYLANYPFEPKNIEIRIFIHKPDNREVDEGKISVVSAIDGVLKYKTDDGPHFSKTIHKESYEEALQKLSITSKF